jgi:hypothetical protein
VEILADGSYIAEVTPPRKSGMAPVQVRVIEYKLPAVTDGKDELYRLVTTIGDPAQAPAKDLAALYHERWDIEGFFKQIKECSTHCQQDPFDPRHQTVSDKNSGHTSECTMPHDAHRRGRRPSKPN